VLTYVNWDDAISHCSSLHAENLIDKVWVVGGNSLYKVSKFYLIVWTEIIFCSSYMELIVIATLRKINRWQWNLLTAIKYI